jgi:hypothetical protein
MKSRGLGGGGMGETQSNRNAEEMKHNIFTRNPEGTRLAGMFARRDRLQAVLHHIQEIQNSKPGYPEYFLGVSHCVHGNAIIALRMTIRLLPSTPFPLYYSKVILPFGAM